jgi:hypothetical protein
MLNTQSTPIRSLLATLLLAAAGGACAQTFSQAAEARVDHREAAQERRIEQGVQSGEVTRREARGLGRQQARIERAESRAGADGKIMPREAARLEHRQDRASAHIRHAKHDRQTRN